MPLSAYACIYIFVIGMHDSSSKMNGMVKVCQERLTLITAFLFLCLFTFFFTFAAHFTGEIIIPSSYFHMGRVDQT